MEQHALNPIPKNERRSWYNIALIWAGAMICVSSLMVGGAIVQGMPILKAIAAGAIGYTIIIVFMTFQGMQGSDLGVPTVVVSSSAFGREGARFIISTILAVSTIGWFGVQANVAGSAFSQIINLWLGINIPVWLSGLLWGIIMLTTAVYGFRALEFLNYIAIPSLIILSLWGLAKIFSSYGMTNIINYVPKENYSWSYAIGLSVGGFAVGGVIAADFSRYANNRKDAMLSGFVGVWPTGVFLLIVGVLLTVVSGTYDITIAVTKLGLGFIGAVILVLATWTTNTVNAYSGGLAIINLFKMKNELRPLMTFIAGAVGTVLAVMGFLNYFTSFLTLLTAGIPPIAGSMIADYWILKKGNKKLWESEITDINWAGIISWILGFLAAMFLKTGISAINGIIISMISYLVLYYPLKAYKTKTATNFKEV
ncbi:cytosine permease [Thermosediminibacter litoriperuensis]|uniref:Cytosine permease n=1 Tax=Thermosediminibacter litoriperuensis TaxID=291989 RepID=A0A5S5AQB2_9FIRM|nr:cytosine permease [Thermosediminibacter litoriperuensis]TYP54223.1 cytosine permease [Thermosediminibacter litoriperuensis]